MGFFRHHYSAYHTKQILRSYTLYNIFIHKKINKKNSFICMLLTAFFLLWAEFYPSTLHPCNRVQLRRGPQMRICNGVQNSRYPENIRKIYIGCPHPTSLSWGKGHMDQGPSELFCVATAVQLTSGMAI